MRTIADFKAMPASLRYQEKQVLEAQAADIAGALAKNNAERSQLDTRIDEMREELAKLNRLHGELDRGLHIRNQEIAGIDAANRSDAEAANGNASGQLPAAGATA
jgi:chromosome segregation ATPase